jgi:hypothetical protein
MESNDISPQPWQKSYATFPKKIGDTWVWFDYYYWREVWTEYSPGVGTYNEWRKEYGTIFDVLNK